MSPSLAEMKNKYISPTEYAFSTPLIPNTPANASSMYRERTQSEIVLAAQANETAQLRQTCTRLNDSQSQSAQEQTDEISRLKQLCARRSRHLEGVHKRNIKTKATKQEDSAGANKAIDWSINCSRYDLGFGDPSSEYANAHHSRSPDHRMRRDSYPDRNIDRNRRNPMPSDDSPSDSGQDDGRRKSRNEYREQNSGQRCRDRTGNSQSVIMALKPVPVNQWKICFSGEPNPMNKYDVNIHKFIATIECICRSASIPKNAISPQMMHLLAGSARDWYQSESNNIHTWDNSSND